ncbi:MAG: LLM class flavin-dependent oxidoreductase [Herpetosiphonaceae bacterium]|nr:LLM class flavin-dependent oxidoreductase [Herpetosiphonaceae bacterium]
MLDISIMIDSATWPQWQRVTRLAEELGYAGLYCGDHLATAAAPDQHHLDLVVALTYVAAQTQRLRFGSCVSPISLRDPVLYTRQAVAINDLSGGRMVLGLGAGWNADEHHVWGYPFDAAPVRWARLQEGIEVATRLLRTDGPVTYHGRFFQLHDAAVLPRAARPPGPLILVGGNGRTRTLPLVARYADSWNALDLTPAQFRAHSAALDDLIQAAGRQPADVRRTLMTRVEFGRDPQELDRRMGWRHTHPDYAGKPLAEVLRAQRDEEASLAGLPHEVADQIAALARAGVQELMLLFEADDVEGIELFAESVLPRIHASQRDAHPVAYPQEKNND